MPIFCGLFRPRGPRKEEHHLGGRARTMSMFGNSNIEAKHLLQKMVGVSTTASPHTHTRPKPPVVDDAASESSQSPALDVYFGTDMREVLEGVYDELKGRDAVLPRAALARFLQHVQGESARHLDRVTYTFGEFLYAWTMTYSLDALAPPPKKDLSRSLPNYFINSSHNTYLSGNQFSSISSPESYKKVLLHGCRCIEIDIWNGDATPSRSKTPGANHHRGASMPALPSPVLDSPAIGRDDVSETGHSVFGDATPWHSRNDSAPSQIKLDDTPTPSSSQVDVSRRARSRHRPTYPRNEPIVTHGWTLTTPCGFREVCEAIKDSAFVNSDLPVIISLEVHAGTEQQRMMVKIMREVWQDLLVNKPFEGCDPRFRVPKLEDVRNKILIKVKRPPVMIGELENLIPSPISPSLATPIFPSKPPPALPMPATPTSPMSMTPTSPAKPPAAERLAPGADDANDKSPLEHWRTAPGALGLPSPTTARSSRGPICAELSALAVYTRSEHFEGFETPAAKKPPHIFSISEPKIRDLHLKQPREMFMHNKTYFMRAFPAGRRIDSSNPDPSAFWRKGVQMVAMNFQNLDEGMMLNEAMFADERGYVLKPPGYLNSDQAAKTQEQAAPGRTLDLSITVLAAQHIPVQGDDAEETVRSGSAVHPLVKAELHVEKPEGADKDGAPPQEGKYKQKLAVAKTNYPRFPPDSTLQFRNIPKVVPELSFVRFKIEDAGLVSSPVLAWACIRLDRLRPGYRFITLMDLKCNPVEGGKLFVKISKTFR